VDSVLLRAPGQTGGSGRGASAQQIPPDVCRVGLQHPPQPPPD